MHCASYAAPFLFVAVTLGVEPPFWGCGLIGDLPGPNQDGAVDPALAKLIDGLKVTNKKDEKVAHWNWGTAPSGAACHEDIVFMPERWGIDQMPDKDLLAAGSTNFDSKGKKCPATMGDIFLGANEPDIYGSCMDGMMGKCTGGPCTPEDVEANECPESAKDVEQGSQTANQHGRCNCNNDVTGVGWWPVEGVEQVAGKDFDRKLHQPLPTCWETPRCVEVIMNNWRDTAKVAVDKGYKYLTAPLIAVNMDWARQFVAEACKECQTIDCGCPTHIAWHFYANDCQPEKGGYADFQKKLDATVKLMEDYPQLQGAIVNEVGMLNCAMDTPDAICWPNSDNQKHKAADQEDGACPATESLPNGLASFAEELLKMVSKAKTKDGRRAVVGFTWFSLDQAGGTYNLQFFKDGALNALGEQYINSCQAWANGDYEGEDVVLYLDQKVAGSGLGFMAVGLLILMVAGAAAGFFFWQRTPKGPRALSGGLNR